MMLLATLPLPVLAEPLTGTNAPAPPGPLTTGVGTNAETEDLPLIPEDAKLFRESMLWLHTATLRTGAGYNDNVFLSPTVQQGSVLITEGLDFSLSRLPLDGWGIDLAVGGDDVRYLQDVPSNGTDFWLGDLTIKRYLGDWVLGMEGLENYLDEVDYVDTVTGPKVEEIEGNVLKAQPMVRRNLGTNGWAEFNFGAARELMDAPLDNTWRYGPEIRLGWAADNRNEISVGYHLEECDHDTWPALSAGGLTTGKTLSVIEQRVELHWVRTWDAANRWNTDTTLFYAHDEDNGGGFFNFNEFSASTRLRYRSNNWEIAATIRGSYTDYPVQRTGVIFGPTLDQTLLHGTLRGERRLTKRLKLYAEYDYERVVSNLGDSRYRVNTATAGLIWEF